MLYAYDLNDQKIKAEPNIKAFCPGCSQPLISKCGDINIWHFAHKSKSQCDYKPSSQWSLEWKSLFPKELVEIKRHYQFVDLILPNNLAVEFQHSSISLSEMIEKTNYWKNILWIFHLPTQYHNFDSYYDYRHGCYSIRRFEHFYCSQDLIKHRKFNLSDPELIEFTGFELFKSLGTVNIPCVYISHVRWVWQSRTHLAFLQEFPHIPIIYDFDNGLMLLRIPYYSFYFSGVLFRKSDFIQFLSSFFSEYQNAA